MERYEAFQEWKSNLDDSNKSVLFNSFKGHVDITRLPKFEEYFNDFIDEVYPSYEMLGITYSPSTIFNDIHGEIGKRVIFDDVANDIEFDAMPDFLVDKFNDWLENDLTEDKLPESLKKSFDNFYEQECELSR